jgi:hypothetical protein
MEAAREPDGAAPGLSIQDLRSDFKAYARTGNRLTYASPGSSFTVVLQLWHSLTTATSVVGFRGPVSRPAIARRSPPTEDYQGRRAVVQRLLAAGDLVEGIREVSAACSHAISASGGNLLLFSTNLTTVQISSSFKMPPHAGIPVIR